jgi:hypothetical protein
MASDYHYLFIFTNAAGHPNIMDCGQDGWMEQCNAMQWHNGTKVTSVPMNGYKTPRLFSQERVKPFHIWKLVRYGGKRARGANV